MGNFFKADDKKAAMFCRCGCSNGIVMQFYPDDDMLILSLASGRFSTDQKGLFSCIKEKLKRMWFIIRNKEYSYFEIVMEKDDVKGFKEFVANL